MAQAPVVEEVGEEANEPAKVSGKKWILIGAAMLALGGAGAWYWTAHDTDKAHQAATPAAPKEPIFVKLDTFTVNLNPDDGEKYLQVDISLNANSQDEADLLKAHMPQVRNRVLMLLTSKTAHEITTTTGKQTLATQLAEQINRPYVKGASPLHVGGVFFTSFVIQ